MLTKQRIKQRIKRHYRTIMVENFIVTIISLVISALLLIAVGQLSYTNLLITFVACMCVNIHRLLTDNNKVNKDEKK